MRAHPVILALMLAGTTVTALADTLVFTNGRRVQGDLISVRGREIEFDTRMGGGRRTLRVGRDEIDRIEFDDVQRLGSGRDGVVGGVPRGMRERQVSVSARSAWTDTGIDVRPGQAVYFAADGQVRWGPERRDGAVGERNSPRNPGRPLPDRPAAALIGRVGDRDEFFFIGGEAGPFPMRSSGRLYLGINDDVLDDNSGNLRVKVSF